MHPLYLVDKLFGSFGALSLVIFEFLMSEGRSWAVEGNSPVSGFDFVQYLEQGTGKALNGVDHFPGLGYC